MIVAVSLFVRERRSSRVVLRMEYKVTKKCVQRETRDLGGLTVYAFRLGNKAEWQQGHDLNVNGLGPNEQSWPNMFLLP